MDRNNHLSESLRAYQNAKNQTLTEFSQELGIARDYDLLYRLGFTAPTVMLLILTSGDFYRSISGAVFVAKPYKSPIGTEWRRFHGRQRENSAAAEREKDRRHYIHRDFLFQRAGRHRGGPRPLSDRHSYQGAENP